MALTTPLGAMHSQLERFVDLLLRWNRVINLVARGDESDIWGRHVSDSLQLREFIPDGVERAIDVGSGAGFPGLVLAIATGVQWELIEADQRKGDFLRAAARETGAPVRIHTARAETLRIEPAALVTARGVARLDRLLPICVPLLKPGALCIFPKGRSARRELTDARRQWHMRSTVVSSRTASDSAILLLSQISPCQPTHPDQRRSTHPHQ